MTALQSNERSESGFTLTGGNVRVLENADHRGVHSLVRDMNRIIDLWQSAADADACAARWESDALAQEFMAFVDRESVRVTRYETLD